MSTFTISVSDLIREDFDFGLRPRDYPIFDEDYRDPLNRKILTHYFNYEIGQETESMFRQALNRKMNEVMPYYNQLYLSEQIKFDPLQTMKYSDTTQSDSKTEGVEESTSETGGKSRSVVSNTPQVQLSGLEDYASNASDVNSETNISGDAKQSGESHANISREVSGSNGIASELLMTYRASLLNIDMMVIEELKSLFMMLWDNGDEFTNPSHNFLGHSRFFGGYNGIL